MAKNKKISPAFKEMVEKMKDFSFRTRDMDHPLESVQHLEGLIKKINQNEIISNNEKLR